MDIIAPGVAWVPTSFVNAYFIGEPGGPWALVDTGLAGFGWKIRAAAAERFGRDSRPEAIFLTHGHFDHSGNAAALSDDWDVPIYAHPLEMPYLTGRSDYPPPDPTVGGAIAMMSRVLPHGSRDLGARLRAYAAPGGPAGPTDAEGPLPGFPAWRWVFTPGHAPGHVSLFRAEDRTLLAGDAVVTMNMDSWVEMVAKQRELSTGGSPFISDWNEYGASLQTLATLEPETLGAGHGYPMSGHELSGDLERFARHFSAPLHGRYVKEPAHTDERGVDWLPPKPTDPFPYLVGIAGLGLAAALTIYPRKKR